MNIIVVGQRHGESRTYRLTTPAKTLLFGCLVALPFAMGVAGFWLSEWLGDEGFSFEPVATEAWENDLNLQKQEIEKIRQQTDHELQALTVKLAELQSRLMRLDALGERLVDVADLSSDEFDFSMAPALGGPAALGDAYQAPEIRSVLNDLADRIIQREQQLEVLDDLMAERRLNADTFVSGRPITKGWMSSRYGRRTDPFTGQLAWHAGVDFAGKLGSDVVAVASGVVTWSGDRYGYGKMVEINHGNGYKTRYAHCQELKVKVGDIVRKGDIVAAMGSSGRSTGPHVHFEVYKNGRTVDPAAYLHRTLR
ncbi:M23 family metallopeptidase [Oceanobacter mangrovi]|uniref:M23 family metallopeptidase n=1 Tax=Oceanobacter mangrovi TaxID=2862510 RepID=UPI001C8F10FC|nr:M23 family metallopeptidase [Oceanobacter mangrovi]